MFDYVILDIETVPIKDKDYLDLEDEEKLKLLNPIDSKVIAIGVKYKEEYKIFIGEEKVILEDFWNYVIRIYKSNLIFVGFNILNFDMSFLVTRSFINSIKIQPFSLRQVIDIRDKIHAYKYGKNRGKLKEFALIFGQDILEVDGSNVYNLYLKKDFDLLEKYLKKDLELTDFLYKKLIETNIVKIKRY